MPRTVSISGASYEIPTSGDLDWGSKFDRWAVGVTNALAAGASGRLIDVKTLGAVGNNVADDRPKLMEAIAALDLNGPDTTIYIPAGEYRISDTLDFTALNYNFRIFADPHAIIRCGFDDPTKPMIRVRAGSTSSIVGLAITADATHRARSAIQFDSGGGSTQMYLERVTVAGTETGTPGGLTYGFDFRGDLNGDGVVESDANNDHATFMHCRVVETISANVYIGHTQSKAHKFYGCFFRGGEYGVDSIGSFMWFGGAMSSHTKSDFRQSTPVNCDPICIDGVNSEASTRFFVTGFPPDTTASSAQMPTILRNVRWANEAAPLDGKENVDGSGSPTYGTSFPANELDGSLGTTGISYPIWFQYKGPLIIDGCRFGVSNMASGARRLKVRCNGLEGGQCILIGSVFAGDHADVSPVERWRDMASYVSLGSLIYVHVATTGAPTYTYSENKLPDRLQADHQQNPSWSTTPSFNPLLGRLIHFSLQGNVTSWTISNGKEGDEVEVHWTQDPTGNRTLAGTPANVLLAGGSLTLTTTASKTDVLRLRWNATRAAWVETSRSMNL